VLVMGAIIGFVMMSKMPREKKAELKLAEKKMNEESDLKIAAQVLCSVCVCCSVRVAVSVCVAVDVLLRRR